MPAFTEGPMFAEDDLTLAANISFLEAPVPCLKGDCGEPTRIVVTIAINPDDDAEDMMRSKSTGMVLDMPHCPHHVQALLEHMLATMDGLT
jgi:hypothetical protein